MRYSISNTAEYRDLTRGEMVVGDATRKAMKKLLKQIQNGRFANEWIKENKEGGKKFAELREAAKQHPIEKVGEQLRAMMSSASRLRQEENRRTGQGHRTESGECVRASSQFSVNKSAGFH